MAKGLLSEFLAMIILAKTIASPDLVLHAAPRLPCSWGKTYGLIPLEQSITVTFALKQRNLDTLTSIAQSVSDPRSAKYGQFLSRAELRRLTASDASHFVSVEDWLAGSGVSFDRLGASSIRASIPLERAMVLLRTEFHHAVNNKTNQRVVRAGDYWLPARVHDAVRAVYGLHGLPAPLRGSLRSESSVPVVNVNPDLINSAYGVSPVEASSVTNRQAVAEFGQQETINATDLKHFFQEFVSNFPAADAIVSKFVGDEGIGSASNEASLDIQYLMGLSPGIQTEFWYWASSDFCGDLKNWTDTILADPNSPLVHSVSYGVQVPLDALGCKDAHLADIDTNFAKLAAAGITIIFSSGDSGSGVGSLCDDEHTFFDTSLQGIVNTTVDAVDAMECCEVFPVKHLPWMFTPQKKANESSSSSTVPPLGTCTVFQSITGKTASAGVVSGGLLGTPKLYPSWPASSPWVTAVGATRFIDQKIYMPEMASDQFGSGGGFSFKFDAFKDQVEAVSHYFRVATDLPPKGSYPVGGRATPDVSLLGEGYQVLYDGQLASVGGTSASAPAFAAMISLINEERLAAGKTPMGYLNPFLYQNANAFTDVTVGTNAIDREGTRTKYGFQCAKGWDPVTGLGTPLFTRLLSAAMTIATSTVVV